MKGGESLGNEEGSEETSEEDRKEEVSPTWIYTPEVRPLFSGVFLCPDPLSTRRSDMEGWRTAERLRDTAVERVG